jgi:hypothetical protein
MFQEMAASSVRKICEVRVSGLKVNSASKLRPPGFIALIGRKLHARVAWELA